MDRPNIILITADQWRGDYLGCSGHRDVKTPYIDSLATTGIRFTNAYSATPTCIPARAALHTGMKQKNHGRVGYCDGVRWDYPNTMAGELAKAGYYTQCVGKMHVHPLRNMMGFHNIELHDGYLHYYRNAAKPICEDQRFADDYVYWLKNELGISYDLTDTGGECNSWVARPWNYEERLHPTNWVTDRALDFFRRRDTDKPFFLNVSYVRPHPPFDAPQCFFDMYRDMEIEEPLMGDWADISALDRGIFYSSTTGPKDPELIRQAKIGYYACMTHIDYQIGRILEGMCSYNLNGNTVIIFTSDHGEMMCDHALYRKSLPYKGSAYIPMIVSGAKGYGKISDKLVELRDIMPTLLELAGAEIPDSVDGHSMIGDEEIPYIHGEHLNGDTSNHYIVTKTDKYIWFSQTGREMYFDLQTDPNELVNTVSYAYYQDRINYLRSCLISELSDREEGFVSESGSLVIGQPLKAVLEKSKKGFF